MNRKLPLWLPSSAAAPSARVDVSTLAGSTGATSPVLRASGKGATPRPPVLSRYEHVESISVLVTLGSWSFRSESPSGATTSPSRRARAAYANLAGMTRRISLPQNDGRRMRSSGCV